MKLTVLTHWAPLPDDPEPTLLCRTLPIATFTRQHQIVMRWIAKMNVWGRKREE